MLAVFIPAIIIGLFVLFIRIIQYRPLFPSEKEYEKIKSTWSFNIPIDIDDPVIGNKKAPLAVIMFSDFGCASCREHMTVLDELMQKHPDKVKIVWKSLPVTTFPYSTVLTHEYAYCLNQQGKFSEFYPLAFINSDNLSEPVLKAIVGQMKIDADKLAQCLASGKAKNYLQKNGQLGMALNMQSVPTMFINNKQIEPPQILEGWEALLKL